MNNCKLFIGNLVFDLTEHELSSLLMQYGSIIHIHLQRKKGYALVEMSTPEEADAVIANLNKTELKGREMRIDHQLAPKTAKRQAVMQYANKGKRPYREKTQNRFDGPRTTGHTDEQTSYLTGKKPRTHTAGKPAARSGYTKRFDRNDNSGRSAESLATEGVGYIKKKSFNGNRRDANRREPGEKKYFDRNDNSGRSAESLASEGMPRRNNRRNFNRTDDGNSSVRRSEKPRGYGYNRDSEQNPSRPNARTGRPHSEGNDFHHDRNASAGGRKPRSASTSPDREFKGRGGRSKPVSRKKDNTKGGGFKVKSYSKTPGNHGDRD